VGAIAPKYVPERLRHRYADRGQLTVLSADLLFLTLRDMYSYSLFHAWAQFFLFFLQIADARSLKPLRNVVISAPQETRRRLHDEKRNLAAGVFCTLQRAQPLAQLSFALLKDLRV
jgi:hypothetical protein